MTKKLSILIFGLTLFCCIADYGFSEEAKLRHSKEYEAKIPVEVIKEITLPKGYHEGLYLNGKYVWVNNGKGGNTWVIDPGTGSVVSEIIPDGAFTEGITSTGDGVFWVTDWDAKKLYRAGIDGDRLVGEYDIFLDPARPAGVVWTGKSLYVITWTRGMGTKYHLLRIDESGEILQKTRITRIHEPAHVAWDGHYLWITSWHSRLVYKVDMKTYSVIGSFRSPASEPTGIVWDGKYFWITGTSANLYKIKVADENSYRSE